MFMAIDAKYKFTALSPSTSKREAIYVDKISRLADKKDLRHANERHGIERVYFTLLAFGS